MIVILFVAGANKNGEITKLKNEGVVVTVTVRECTGQLGGSGSNAAAYRCVGTFTLGGRWHSDTIPGGTFRPSGSTVRLVTTKGDPGLIATVEQVQSEHTSWRVFALPSMLLVGLIAVVAIVAVRRRQKGVQAQSGERAHLR